MIKSYVVKVNLIEIQHCRAKVMDIVREQKCIGFGGEGEIVTFHFADSGSAMMVFLELEGFLDCVSVSAYPVLLTEEKLKGVFKYD